MVRLRPDEILEEVRKKGFEKVWAESTCFLLKEGKARPSKAGRTHPIFDLIQRLRSSFIQQGFDEVLNPIIVEDVEVHKQYGPEAAVILDRCFYLATLPRPDIGLGEAELAKLRELSIALDEEKLDSLRDVLRDYKKGLMPADDLTERIAAALKVDSSKAMQVISEVFPEFVKLKPIPTSLILRSHMTSAWFKTLQALQHKRELPIKLFSVDVKFRREQREDPTHLRSSFIASCVLMDEAVTAEDGKDTTKALLKPLGIEELRFKKKSVTSRYYAPETEYEVYAFFPANKDWLEIANFGLYSPIALAHYGLEHPVLNIGIGVERVGMILHGETDIRRLAYPQLYAEWRIPDEQLARMIRVSKQPTSRDGRSLAKAIVEGALDHAKAASPCEFEVFSGRILGRDVHVSVYESDPGKELLGPAALNEVYVYDGNVLAIPPVGLEESSLVLKAREKGVKTGIRFLHSVAAKAAWEVEERVKKGLKGEVDVRVKMAKHPSDVNIELSEVAQRYVSARRRRVMLKGPVFLGVKAEVL